MKKYIALLIAAILPMTILADRNPPNLGDPANPTQEIVNELKALNANMLTFPSQIAAGMSKGFAELEKYIASLYTQNNTWEIAQNYEPIPNLYDIKNTNTVKISLGEQKDLSPLQAIASAAFTQTKNNLYDSMLEETYSMYQQDTNVIDELKTSANEDYSSYLSQNSPLSISTIPGPDSLYVLDADGKLKMNIDYATKADYLALLKKPETPITSDAFNFATIVTPMAYTPEQLKAANQFLLFAARSTESLLGGVNFADLYGKPEALFKLKQNPDYQHFVLMIRNFLSIRSISINLLNQLIAERTPVKGLGAAAGLSADKSASPLEVEAYRANHRLEDPRWYSSIENASPATVQREMLILLAEIEHQNFQAYLDNEKILGAITSLNLSSSTQTIQLSLPQEIPKLKD